MKPKEMVRHAYEVCAQIAEKHKGCEGRHPTGDPRWPDHVWWKTCGQLIAEEIRNTQGSKNPSPRCGRTWESLDGNRVFTCPRKAAHRGLCGDNTNKRRNDGEWRELRMCECAIKRPHMDGQWWDGTVCEACEGKGWLRAQ